MAERLTAGLRSALTLLVLLGLLLAGVVYGWSALTEPLPEAAETAVCDETTVPAGTKVYPDQVTVSVANAGQREGLAGRTMQLLVDAGFGAGQTGNAPGDADVSFAEIWTDDPRNPAVRLVRGKLGGRADIVERPAPFVGVTVVVGDEFMRLREGGAWTRSDRDSTVCTPPAGTTATDDEG